MDAESIKRYLEKSGDKKLPDGNLEENEHGFCIWRINKTELTLAAVYGDGVYWNNWATMKAMKECVKNIYCATRRNPKAYVRKHGFEVVGYVLKRTI